MLQVALLAIEAGEIEHHLFGVGIDGLRGLELLFRVRGVVVDVVELTEQQAVFDAVGFKADDLDVLGDGELEHFVGRSAVLHVAERAQIDAAEELVRVEAVGVFLQQILRGVDGVADAAGLEIELGQPVVEVLGFGIGVQSQLVLFNGTGGVFGAAVGGRHLLIAVSQRVVIVSRGAVRGGGGCAVVRLRGWCGGGLRERQGAQERGTEEHAGKGAK